MKVRIRKVPRETEVDGVNLGSLAPGVVREFSASVGSWLIAEGYGEPEMRAPRTETRRQSSYDGSRDHATEPRRRRTDR
jgi:hypothetical protein